MSSISPEIAVEGPAADQAGTTGAGERERVFAWRLESLERAGWARTPAFLIALDTRLDLHVACDLVARGCSPYTALQILL